MHVALLDSATIDTNPFTDNTESLSVSVAVGDLVVAIGTWDGSRTFTSCEDDGSNTYSPAESGAEPTGSQMVVDIRFTIATSSATSVTWTVSGPTSNSSLTILVFSGATASPLGDTAEAATSATQEHDSGSVTTTVDDSILVGALVGSNGVYTVDADFTQVENDNTCLVAYKILSATGTHSMTTSSSPSNEACYSVLVEFQGEAEGGGGTAVPVFIHQLRSQGIL